MNAETLEPLIRACLDKSTVWRIAQKDEVAGGLARDLAGKLPPTFDELLKLAREATHSGYIWISVDWLGSGVIKAANNSQIEVRWPGSDTPGKAAIEAMEAAMTPEPTARERGLEALKRVRAYHGRHPVTWIAEDYQTIREALEE